MNDEFENALMAQKDHIRGLVFEEKFEEALALLDFSERLWASVSYAYKTREVKELIKDTLRKKIHVCAHWKQHQKWKTLHDSIR